MKLFAILVLALAPCILCRSEPYRPPTHKSVCTLPKDPGPCKAYFEKWYYDQASGQCKEFIYGGCGGNRNRFDRLADCQAQCGYSIQPYPGTYPKPHPHPGSSYSNLYMVTSLESYDVVCTLKPDAGRCEAAIPRYYYNKNTGLCTTFTYGGCGGNENNFETKEDCEKQCGRSGPYPKPSKPGRPFHPPKPPKDCGRHKAKCFNPKYKGHILPAIYLPPCCPHYTCCACPQSNSAYEVFGTCQLGRYCHCAPKYPLEYD